MLHFLNKHSLKLLWLCIIAYIGSISLLIVWKYFNFGYNGLDLAIFNQVYFNSVHGNLFQFTIHPQSYLGDHFVLILVLILPFYYLFQHPLTLLILQTVIIALTAWPIYKITLKALGGKVVALLFALIWLFNPFVQNINLFEFHHLAFAVFLLFWSFYFYQQKNFKAFIIFLLLSLVVREDVALVTFMFGLLALLDKRSLRWIIWPMIISVGWFVFAMKMIGYFSPEGQYKFLYYYSWLGSNWTEIIKTIITEPLTVLKKILTWQNIFFTLGLLLPFAFLLRLKYLLLGLAVYAQIVLGRATNTTIVLSLHYSALFLPALFISLIYFVGQLRGLPLAKFKNPVKKFLSQERKLIYFILIATTAYACLSMGPLPSVFQKSLLIKTDNLRPAKAEMLKNIGPKDSVAATYELLTPLSSRQEIYSLHYGFLGKRQFSDADYRLPEQVNVLAVDFKDFITYAMQFPNVEIWKKYYHTGDDRIRSLILDNNFGVKSIDDTLVLLEKNYPSDKKLYQIIDEASEIQNSKKIKLENDLEFLGWSKNSDERREILPLSFYFSATEELDQDYQLKISFSDSSGKSVFEKIYPLAYGLYPTSDWEAGQIIKINYWFNLPDNLADSDFDLQISLVKIKGYLSVDSLLSVKPRVEKIEELTPSLDIDL